LFKCHDCINALLNRVNALQIENEVLKAELQSNKRPCQEAGLGDLIKKLTIQNIGGCRIDYRDEFDSGHVYLDTDFAFNSNGFALVGRSYIAYEKVKLLLYNWKGDLLKNTVLNHRIGEIGISNDAIYITTYTKDGQTFRIQSFDFDLNPKECFNDTVQHQISAYHQIDISKDRVYYKVEIEPLKNQFSYLIYVFNLDLSRAHVFCLESLNNSDVLIKNEMAYYNKENGDGSFSFFVRSLKTRELVHNFRLEFDSLFDYDVGPNGNLFVFVNNTSTINEYNTDGFIVQAVRLSIEPSVDRYCQLRINDTFDFTIHDKDRRVVYFNSQ
jgi:hypothetical protein